MKIWLALLLLLAAVTSANATDSYVTPTGSGVLCTSGAPCGNIAAAASVVTAGGTLYVAPGYYRLPVFSTTMAGTAGNIITVKCQAGPSTPYVRGGCVITPGAGSGTSGILWEIDGGGYVTVDGLQLDGRGEDGSTWTGGLYASPNAGGPVTFQNNIVHHLAQVPTNICNSQGGAGITGDSYHSTAAVINVYKNIVHDIGAWAQGCNTIQGIYLSTAGGGTVSNNIIYNVSGYCINQYHDATNFIIVNNTMAKCVNGGILIGVAEWYLGNQFGGQDIGGAGTEGGVVTTAQTLTSSNVLHFGSSVATPLSHIQNGWGLYVAGGINQPCGHGTSGNNTLTVTAVNTGTGDVTLSGNVCVTIGVGLSVLFGPVSNNNYVAYNITYDSPLGIYEFAATGTSNTYTRNLTASNSSANISLQNGNTSSNEVTTDPAFVDYVSGGTTNDLRLLPGSPALGAAAATNAPATDFTGLARPQGGSYDIGAYEAPTNSNYFTTSAGQLGTANAARLSQLDIVGNALGLDNTGGQLHLHSNVSAYFDKWIRLNDISGALEITNNLGVPVLALDDTGTLRFGQYANSHGNTGVTCNGTNGLSTINGSGLTQTCRYLFTGAGSAASGTVVLTTDGNAAGAHNCANMPVNSGGTWSAQLHATDIGTRGRDWSWTMPSGAFYRDAANITITSGTAVATVDRGTVTGIAAAMTADTTNQCFHLAWTHPSSDSDLYNVSAYIDITEISP